MVHIKKKKLKKKPQIPHGSHFPVPQNGLEGQESIDFWVAYSEFLISGPEIGPRNMHFIQEPDNADITNAGPHF